MKRPPRLVLLFVLALLFSLVGAVDRASAQVVNPAGVAFTPAEDHALLSAYEFGYFTTSADPDPIRTKSIARSEVVLVGGEFTFPFPRLAFGSFTHKLRACAVAVGGGTVCSPWEAADKTTVVSPFRPAAVRVQ